MNAAIAVRRTKRWRSNEARPRHGERGVVAPDLPIRVIRVIRGEIISAFPRRVFGNVDRRAMDRTLDRAGAVRE